MVKWEGGQCLAQLLRNNDNVLKSDRSQDNPETVLPPMPGTAPQTAIHRIESPKR